MNYRKELGRIVRLKANLAYIARVNLKKAAEEWAIEVHRLYATGNIDILERQMMDCARALVYAETQSVKAHNKLINYEEPK